MRRRSEQAGNEVSHFAGDPEGTFWQKYFGGIIVPVALFLVAVYCWVTQKAILPGRHRMDLPLEGKPAIAMGFLCFGIALFLHAHYFQSTVHQYISETGKLIGILAILASLAYVAYAVAVQ